MTKLDKLIEKLCPKGVEYKRLEELLDYEQPSKYIVKSTKYDDTYEIPVLTAGQSFILGHTNEHEGIYEASKENPVIIFDDFTTSFHWVDFKFKVKSSAMKILMPRNKNINFRYIYYVMNTISFIPENHSRHWISVYSQFLIPVPPLEVQHEIVHILDRFTELSTELTTQLSAELKARQKQYNYFENQLLNKAYKVVKLGDICDICAGGTPSKTKSEYWNNGTIKWLGSTVCKNKKYVDEVTGYITELGLKNSSAKLMRKKTTLIGMVGATIGKVSFLDFEAATNQNIACLYPKNDTELNPDYLYYACKNLYPIFLEFANGKFTIASLSFIKSLEISLPSYEEQEKIVNRLERLDRLCNDTLESLPAEIEARKKQYEYYRNKLLTFKELKINE